MEPHASGFSPAFKLSSTQRGLLLDALYLYARLIPPALTNDLQQLIHAAHTAAYFVKEQQS